VDRDEIFLSSLRELREQAHHELVALEAARRRLKALIAFANDYTGDERKPDVPTRVQEEIRAHPGMRSTMVAMQVGLSIDSVQAAVKELEAAGVVVRSGLGWRIASNDGETTPD
jgi:predicted transcriptional regulator